MEFFAMPSELNKWISSVLDDQICWILLWDISTNTYSTISDSHEYISTAYSDNSRSASRMQLFIGNRQLRSNPIMRTTQNGRREIDFKHSLCVQVVPCLITDHILLEGSIATLKPKEYDGIPCEREFRHWKQQIIGCFTKMLSDRSFVTTQILSDGTVKEWRRLIVSSGAVAWYREGGKLRQFAKGPVEFIPRQRR